VTLVVGSACGVSDHAAAHRAQRAAADGRAQRYTRRCADRLGAGSTSGRRNAEAILQGIDEVAAQADADLAAVFIHEGEQYFAVFISLAIVDQIDEGKRVIDRRPVYAPALRGFVL